ncbi:armadillo/beta-catenin-like repeats-containing protein [Dorcoceras hygrometricum]|uniref:Armadillo/beta-catenin-like repeats-containing protein n=1 Tax=Dorcoceras hygrometricum TaxID=472368 RepID=A0A2Z6ZUF8_9LAMI|nr:armadillo/beta-catenin-like repeats-containing protein [Dorcoceras hygrometricum]
MPKTRRTTIARRRPPPMLREAQGRARHASPRDVWSMAAGVAPDYGTTDFAMACWPSAGQHATICSASARRSGRPIAQQVRDASIGRATSVVQHAPPSRVGAQPCAAVPRPYSTIFFCLISKSRFRCNSGNKNVLKDPSLCSDTTVGIRWWIRIPLPGGAAEIKNSPRKRSIHQYKSTNIHRMFVDLLPCWRLGAWLQPEIHRENLALLGRRR